MLTLASIFSRRRATACGYLPPEEFDHLGRLARHMGFERVASGPFVRSSYHAGMMLNAEC